MTTWTNLLIADSAHGQSSSSRILSALTCPFLSVLAAFEIENLVIWGKSTEQLGRGGLEWIQLATFERVRETGNDLLSGGLWLIGSGTGAIIAGRWLADDVSIDPFWLQTLRPDGSISVSSMKKEGQDRIYIGGQVQPVQPLDIPSAPTSSNLHQTP